MIKIFYYPRWILYFPYVLGNFVSMSYWKHTISLLVMTVSTISVLFKKSDEMWSQHAHQSRFKISEDFFYHSKPCQNLLHFHYSAAANSRTLHLWSEHTKIHTEHMCICYLCFWLSTSCIIVDISSHFLESPVSFKNTKFV